MFAYLVMMLLLPASEPNEAEKLFREMETKVMKGKTLECVFEFKMEGETTASGTGTLLAADGNKCRLEMTGKSGAREGKSTVIADGTQMVAIQDKQSKQPTNTPQWLGEYMRVSITRPGLPLPIIDPPGLDKQDKGFKVDELYLLGDFKLGKKEMVGKQEAQILQYTLTLKRKGDNGPPFAVTVWIDTKTQLPLKRVLIVTKSDKKTTFTMLYSKLDLDAKIDPKQFELPK